MRGDAYVHHCHLIVIITYCGADGSASRPPVFLKKLAVKRHPGARGLVFCGPGRGSPDLSSIATIAETESS